MPRYRYLTEFHPLAAKYPMLSFLFPRSTQITSALGALNAANLGLSEVSRNCSLLSLDEEENPPVLCLVLGDGGDPRTAVLAVIQKRWSAVAIDPNLDAKWEKSRELLPDGCRFMGFRGSMTRFLAEGYKMVQSSLCPLAEIQHLVIICVEQGANFDQLKSLGGRLGLDDLRILFNNVPSTVVSMSSDEILHECPLKSPPDHTLVDQDILTSNRRVQVWNFQSSHRSSFSSPSLKSTIFHRMEPRNMMLPHRHSIRRLYDESISFRSSKGCFVPSKSIRRITSSKVAQLHRQQELAGHNRIKLSAMRISEQTLERERHASAAGTDGTNMNLAISDQDQSPTSSYKQPRASMKKRLSMFVRVRRTSILPKKKDSKGQSNLRKTVGSKTDSSGVLLQEKSSDFMTTLQPAPTSDSFTTNPVCFSALCKHSPSLSSSNVEDILLDFAGLTPPSSMSRSASESPTTHDKKPVPYDDKTFSSKTRIESTCDSSLSERAESIPNSTLQEGDAGPPKTHSRPTSITQNHYKPGDIVEVKVHNLYQVGMVDNQPFKGVYNVTLFSDTPAWNEKRAHVDIYRCSPERLPEVLARDIRPFSPAPIGEIIYVFVNRIERKCCVHGYLYDKSDAPSPAGHVKCYLVRFAGNDGDWTHEEHRVPFKRAYRKICSACG